ncbi:hypothetical protein ID128_00705 [Candidatus Wolbachia massiliensis]|uniref:Uncharacterized protein n=1 Tax=Candidatus Wolbachia massiliensis TaxID=1845000 RepID=A0A7M3U317_9RICK|nr:hypothetical protein ID128_00705 [Candidatus Wolbachia massiliensis]
MSETAVPDEIVAQSNLTNPFAMYHLQPGVTAGEIRKQESYEKALRGQDIKLDASNLQDVSSETLVSPPSTPSNSRKNGGGPSIN